MKKIMQSNPHTNQKKTDPEIQQVHNYTELQLPELMPVSFQLPIEMLVDRPQVLHHMAIGNEGLPHQLPQSRLLVAHLLGDGTTLAHRVAPRGVWHGEPKPTAPPHAGLPGLCQWQSPTDDQGWPVMANPSTGKPWSKPWSGVSGVGNSACSSRPTGRDEGSISTDPSSLLSSSHWGDCPQNSPGWSVEHKVGSVGCEYPTVDGGELVLAPTGESGGSSHTTWGLGGITGPSSKILSQSYTPKGVLLWQVQPFQIGWVQFLYD